MLAQILLLLSGGKDLLVLSGFVNRALVEYRAYFVRQCRRLL